MADTRDLKSLAARRAGSSPAISTETPESNRLGSFALFQGLCGYESKTPPLDPSHALFIMLTCAVTKKKRKTTLSRECTPKSAGATGKPLLAPQSEISLLATMIVVWNKRVLTYIPGALRSPLDPSHALFIMLTCTVTTKIRKTTLSRECTPKSAGATGKPLLAPQSENFLLED
jgi:hypothetical protein